MTHEDVKIGDIVRLNSGGAWMTVAHKESPDLVIIEWMSLSGEYHTQRVKAAMLEKTTKVQVSA